MINRLPRLKLRVLRTPTKTRWWWTVSDAPTEPFELTPEELRLIRNWVDRVLGR